MRDPIGNIARGIGLSARDVVRIISNAPQRYRVYQIPKRDGGTRTIAHPAKPLKLIQRYLTKQFLSKLPVSVAAHAYREGVSIRSNAEVHADSRVIMKMDFRSFFPSIVSADLLPRLPAEIRDDETMRKVFELSLFWYNRPADRCCLAIGAPSSPTVSNCVMYEFDEALRSIVASKKVKYTRYADDLTFSGQTVEELEAIEVFVRELIANTRSPSLVLNESKRGIYTLGMRRMVTGVKITPEQKVSLGRERKRMISSLVFRAKLDQLSKEQLAKTRGWMAFANSIEPEFLGRLRTKYGAIVDQLMRMPIG